METRTDEHGSVVDVVTKRPAPVRRPLGPPPSKPVAVYGRAAPLNRVTDAISGSSPIVVAGAAGAGKSTLIAAAANGPEAAAVSDGIVLIRTTADGEQRAPDWIAQEIYSAIWDTGEERRYLTALIARAELADIHPLVLVDGPSLRLEDFRAVADIVPGSPLVIASERLPVGGSLQIVSLPPLPRADSVRLLAELTGTDPATGAPALTRAAELLDNWPGALATVGGVIGAGRVGLEDAIVLMEAASPGDRPPPARGYVRALAVLDRALTADERAMLEAIAGFAGVPVRDDVASRIAGQGSMAAADSLVASTVARHNSPQLTVDEGLLDATRQSPDHERATTLATEPADALAANPEWLLADGGLDPADLPVALVALDAAWKQANWPSVRAFARAIDPVVSSRGMWDVWADVLAKARGAAIRSDATADIAWADHQLGTRALASGDLETAGEVLEEAAAVRDGLGLTDAAARTRHNIETLRGLLAPPAPPAAPPSAAGRPWLGLFVAAIVVIGILVLGPRIVEAVLNPVPGPTPSAVTQLPTEASTVSPTAPRSTTEPTDEPSSETVPPPPPALRLPAAGSILHLNCRATSVSFAWSQTERAVEWLFEAQQLSGESWVPAKSEDGLLEPLHSEPLDCDRRFRWRAAALSADGSQSEFSPWSEFAILPTAIPVPITSGDLPCRETTTLEWGVAPADDISEYVVEVTDQIRQARNASPRHGVVHYVAGPLFHELHLARKVDRQAEQTRSVVGRRQILDRPADDPVT
jgi:hypothetical protein